MTKSTLGRLAGATLALAGLVYGPGTRLASAAKPNTNPPVPLTVTVAETDSAGNPCRICADAAGPTYTNGVDGVTANIDQYGSLIINFNASATPLARKLVFDYSAPVAAGNEYRPPAAQNSYMSTIGPTGGPIQNMEVGAVQCVQSNITFTDTDANRTLYRNHFHRPLSGHDVSESSWLVVTRLSSTSWEVEPKAAACNTGDPTVAILFSVPTKGHGVTTNHGAWFLPFKMTLVRQ